MGQEWGDQFDDVLKAAKDPETGQPWHPAWYHGQVIYLQHGGFQAGNFSSALGRSMASSFAAAASPPSSASGSAFGGGGFSGGMGGGGGGGGGW
ncbi:hypothetical protein [Iodidimonas gelatinilytica]|uniref:hypothetical protein n=1 Tax=Iodidimonas gelatinilytica TaxID=1236966 RepID=UPI001B2FF57E|nr:hypothetical protein [Iodidimonas gelatinilytica]